MTAVALAVPTPTEQLSSRMNDLGLRMCKLIEQLDDHADRLHGPYPTGTAESDAEQGPPAGALPLIDFRMTRLEEAMTSLEVAAARNTGLA